jgi:hypothetical protein
MAEVFAGREDAFDPVWSGAGHFGSHHYARPLLPFVAGTLTRAVPGLGVPAAFSVVNVVGAWVVAATLYLWLAHAVPALALAWLPSALFLTGFPQIDWGFHLLTDTIGYATALPAAVAVWAFLRWREGGIGFGDPRVPLALLGLAALQSLAFLARETGWFVPVVAVVLLLRAGFPRRHAATGLALLAALGAALVPRALYVRAFDLHPLGFFFTPSAWVAPGYVLDLVVKSALAFHVAWIAAVLGARRGGWAQAPDLLGAWGAAALLYLAAGYVRNSLDGIGYPLRLTFGLFPLVYFLAARGLERATSARVRTAAALLLVLGNAAIGVTATLLDRGETVTVPSLMRGGTR